MRTLMLLRHAKSDWKDSTLPDHERPLNKRGRRAARTMGEFLRTRGLVPDRVLTSSAVRAKQTAERVCRHCGYAGPVRTLSGLYLADPGTILAHLHGLDEDACRVMCVGHNPGLEDLASTLARRYERLPTAALALFVLEASAWGKAFEPGAVRRFEVFRVKEIEPEPSR